MPGAVQGKGGDSEDSEGLERGGQTHMSPGATPFTQCASHLFFMDAAVTPGGVLAGTPPMDPTSLLSPSAGDEDIALNGRPFNAAGNTNAKDLSRINTR